MKDIIIQLLLIHEMSKQLHYEVYGEAAYGKHLLMDRVNKKLLKYVDSIKENYFLYNDLPVPTAEELTLAVNNLLTGFPVSINTLRDVIKHSVKMIDKTCKSPTSNAELNLDQGDFDLLGQISSTLKNSAGILGLITRENSPR